MGGFNIERYRGNPKIIKKATALVAKLDEIHAATHVEVIYTGPSYETELEELRKVLTDRKTELDELREALKKGTV